MTAKEYLKQIEQDKILINRARSRLCELAALSTTLKGVSYDFDRVQSSGNHSMDNVEKIVDLEIKIRNMIYAYLDMSERIIIQINELGDIRASELLYLRYVDCLRWEEIACRLNMGIRGVYKAHGRALSLFEKKYKLFI